MDETRQITCWKCGGKLHVAGKISGVGTPCPHCSVEIPVPPDLRPTWDQSWGRYVSMALGVILPKINRTTCR